MEDIVAAAQSALRSESSSAPNREQEQYMRMTGRPVPSLIISMAAPTIMSMLVTALYNMADTFFVSKIGTSASGAVGIVFSIMAIIQALGFMLGMGAGSIVSRQLGKKDAESAGVYASTSFILAFAAGIIITVGGLLFLDELMKMLGSTATILPYARSYARIILLGAPLMCASFVMNNILRAEGHASFSMRALVSGAVINTILDPVFIFVFNMGTAGAAFATVISQCISFSILLSFFIRQKNVVRLSLVSFRKIASCFPGIFKMGLPSLLRQGLASVSTVLLNNAAAVYGDSSVAAVSIVTRVVMFVASIIIGLGQGFTPVSGYNYGAKLYGRVRESFWFTVKAGTLIVVTAAAAGLFFAPTIVAFFRNDPEVVAVGAKVLRYQSLALIFHGFIVAVNMLMQSTGKAVEASFLACNRQGFYFIPLILLLPPLFGLNGVLVTQAAADLLSFFTAIPYLVIFMRNIQKIEKTQMNSNGVS